MFFFLLLLLLPSFCSNALHLKRQHIPIVRSSSLILHSKHEAAKCNIEQAFSIPIWKRLEEHASPPFELPFQTLLSRRYLTASGTVVRVKWDCELHAASSPCQLGHIGPGLCWNSQIRWSQLNSSVMGSPGSFLTVVFSSSLSFKPGLCLSASCLSLVCYPWH